MKIECVDKFEDWSGALIVPFWQGELASPVKKLAPFAPFDSGDFSGKYGQIAFEYREGKRVVLVGLGNEEDLSAIRDAYGDAIACLLEKEIVEVRLVLPKCRGVSESKILQACLDGCLIGNYAFDEYVEKKKARLKSLSVFSRAKDGAELCQRAKKLFGGVDLCRELVDGNADFVNPDKLCDVAKQLAKKHTKLRTTIFRMKEIQKRGMGLLEAVGRASPVEPALICMHYNNAPGAPTVLLGKGVTYDTGGLSIKPSEGMYEMRCDMGGSGAVIGAMEAIAALNLKVNVVGVVAAAENAIGSKSYKVGDVYFSYSGKSVEIYNTDAEGRLCMADAITYSCRDLKAECIVDLATLTGAIEVALGNVRSGLFSNDNSLRDEIMEAGEECGELLWPMPLDKKYREVLKTNVADICHIQHDRKAGAVVAAKFLEEFVEEGVSWAHVDIAGLAFLPKPKKRFRSNATGFGVRFVVEWIEKKHAKG